MPFKLDLPDKTGSLGSARSVLQKIGEKEPKLQAGICNDWRLLTTTWKQQDRDNEAWSVVRKYNLCLIELTLNELWALTNVLSSYGAGKAKALGCRLDQDRVRLYGRFSYIDRKCISDMEANKTGQEISEQANALRDECLKTLETEEAVEAKKVWLKEEATRKERATKLMEGRLSD